MWRFLNWNIIVNQQKWEFLGFSIVRGAMISINSNPGFVFLWSYLCYILIFKWTRWRRCENRKFRQKTQIFPTPRLWKFQRKHFPNLTLKHLKRFHFEALATRINYPTETIFWSKFLVLSFLHFSENFYDRKFRNFFVGSRTEFHFEPLFKYSSSPDDAIKANVKVVPTAIVKLLLIRRLIWMANF